MTVQRDLIQLVDAAEKRYIKHHDSKLKEAEAALDRRKARHLESLRTQASVALGRLGLILDCDVTEVEKWEKCACRYRKGEILRLRTKDTFLSEIAKRRAELLRARNTLATEDSTRAIKLRREIALGGRNYLPTSALRSYLTGSESL